jgi:ABC-type dipeptide/oligopeptide/nickel transport system permease subunit
MWNTFRAAAPLLAPPTIPTLPYQFPCDGYGSESQAPDSRHPFGTTQGENDLRYAMIGGTPTAFKVGLIVTTLTVLIGGSLGAVAAFVGLA